MSRPILLIPLFLAPLAAAAQLPAPTPTPLIGARSLSLSPDGSRLAFSYQGDIWVVPTIGGRAIPLTTNVEFEDNPIWSPDGQWIAFNSNRNGNNDIYVVSAEGGTPRRLTWYTGNDVPADWSPDGRTILERATRDDPNNGIYAIDVASGKVKQLFLDMTPLGFPHYSPDGSKILYLRMYEFPWVRARYAGSGAAQIWTYDLASGQRTKVRSNGFQHLWPNWSPDGKRIYTVTVTEKTPSSHYLNKPIPKVKFNIPDTPNVYTVSLGGSAKRMTGFVDEGTRFLTVARKADVKAFERDGDVYIVKGEDEPKKIVITASTDDKTPQEERLILTGGVSSADLSPKGDQYAFTVRGELWLVPTKREDTKDPNRDDATQLTSWEGVDTQPQWSTDNKTLFFVSDREGQERLYRMDVATKDVMPVSRAPYDVGSLRLTPDGKSLSYWQTGAEGGLYVVPIVGGEPKKVLSRPGSYPMDYDWSPDGRYVAYSDTLVGSGYYYWDSGNSIFIVDTTTGKSVNVTQLNANHENPRWSPDGKYLFFRSNRSGQGIYVLPLQKEDAPANLITLKYEKPKDPVKVQIDFDDIETRSRPIIRQLWGDLRIDPENGDIYFLSDGDLWKANYNGDDPKRVTNGGGIGSFDFSQDRSQIQFVKNGQLNTLDLRKPGNPTNTVAFRADWTRDVKKEHVAAFNQFYREYNRGFYDPNFHGRDWNLLKARYAKFLPSVGHRNEMANVLNMMVGELESSHSEVGPAAGNPSSQTSANLGFLIDYTYDGPGIRIKEVPAKTPGSYAKSKLVAGEIVTKINGKPVKADEALYRDVLNEQVGRDLTMTVQGADGKTRDVKYRALSSNEFGGIIWNNRLAARRKYVEAKSGGKLTYVHIAGMGDSELQRLNQQLWMYAQGKKGVIIDVRNNGGGNTSDRIIDVLERRQNSFYQVRDEAPMQGPGQALGVPMVVMAAESSFSNAEMFPAAMKARGLATLVGMPTPGYVIYTGGFELVDGTSCRMPGTGVYRTDGSPLEDMGQVPDYQVDITPEEYLAGKDPQLDKAIEVLLKQAGS